MLLYTIMYMMLKGLMLMVPVLLSVAFLTLVERKVMAAMQRSRGPNIVGLFGLLQPFADAAKLIVKETVVPLSSNYLLFAFAPILTLFLSLLAWAVIPFQEGVVLSDIDLGMLYMFAMSSLGVYGVIIAGWSSNSKYAFLGALRSSAQMISYEVSIGLMVMSVLVCAGSLNFTTMVLSQQDVWYIVGLLPFGLLFFVSALAETNSPPFDLPEAEGELVAGYFVEYSAAGFALYFIAEYGNIMLMSTLVILLFFGGWLPLIDLNLIEFSLWLPLKVSFVLMMFIAVSASVPSYSYDQLMYLGWKVFLPLTLGLLVTMMPMMLWGCN